MQVECRENYEIKTHTSFKIGGKVNKVWFPKTQDELVYLLKNLEDYILTKIAERDKAKKEKDFSRADAIRDELLSRGIKLIDTREGTTYEIIK